MDGYMILADAATTLGHNSDDKGKAAAKAVLSHFGVEVKVEPLDTFPHKRTVFNEVQVRRVAEFKL